MTNSRDIWIQVGYEAFAADGPGGLKIEAMARRAGISKSSFYHHFADLDIFTDCLLTEHLRHNHLMAQKEQQATCIAPDLVQILADHRTDLLFHKQLRVHRNHPPFLQTLQQADLITGSAFALVWVRELNLRMSDRQLSAFFELALENFYLQIHADNLHVAWLTAYFAQLKRIAADFV